MKRCVLAATERWSNQSEYHFSLSNHFHPAIPHTKDDPCLFLHLELKRFLMGIKKTAIEFNEKGFVLKKWLSPFDCRCVHNVNMLPAALNLEALYLSLCEDLWMKAIQICLQQLHHKRMNLAAVLERQTRQYLYVCWSILAIQIDESHFLYSGRLCIGSIGWSDQVNVHFLLCVWFCVQTNILLHNRFWQSSLPAPQHHHLSSSIYLSLLQ